eukprot:4292340-Amphidinium_carterae.1
MRTRVLSMGTGVTGVNERVWAEFVSFAKTDDLVEFVRNNFVLQVTKDPSYIPPRASWGKAWIEKEYEWRDTMSDWALRSKDRSTIHRNADGVPSISTELVDALLHPEDLEFGLSPKEIRQMSARGEMRT